MAETCSLFSQKAVIGDRLGSKYTFYKIKVLKDYKKPDQPQKFYEDFTQQWLLREGL